jgi:hypothetical protein
MIGLPLGASLLMVVAALFMVLTVFRRLECSGHGCLCNVPQALSDVSRGLS